MEQIEKSLDRYFTQLDRSDLEEPALAEAREIKLKEKITALKEKM